MAGRVIFFEILWKSLQAETPPPWILTGRVIFFLNPPNFFPSQTPPQIQKNRAGKAGPKNLLNSLRKTLLDPKIQIFFGPAKPARKNYEIPLENRILELQSPLRKSHFGRFGEKNRHFATKKS